MQPTYSADAEAYRQKVQAFLAEKLPSNWAGIGAARRRRARRRSSPSGARRSTRRTTSRPGGPSSTAAPACRRLEQVILAEEFARAGVPDRRAERRVRHPDARQHAADVGHRRAEGALPAAHPVRARTPGARATPSRTPAPTSATSVSRPNSTATSGSSTARRSGPRPATSPTTSSRSPAPTPTLPSTRASRSCSSPMDQPGIEVRPIKMISGDSEFNEVFYTDARCPKENVVGGVNDGWARRDVAARLRAGRGRGDRADPLPGRARPAASQLARGAWRRRRSRHPPEAGLVPTRRCRSCATSACGRSPSSSQGHHPGPDGAISKLYWSEYHLIVTELAVDILGADAMTLDGSPAVVGVPDRRRRCAANSSASWVGTFLNARAGTIYAGSSQIQRNIIGEMVLGTPQGAPPDSDRGSSRRRRARHPSLWPTAIRQGARLVPHRGGGAVARSCPCRRVRTCEFRLVTQYGDTDRRPSRKMC